MEEEGDNKNDHVYKECQRNYAASLGSYATDGCGEFTLDHTSPPNSTLQCAACGCHRNFHRKVTYSSNRRQLVAAVEEERSSGINNKNKSKKRLRTKFTADQKEKMLAFAEKLGWKLPRKYNEEEDEVERFCRGVGISRHVFKIWMHNHKNSSSLSAFKKNR